VFIIAQSNSPFPMSVPMRSGKAYDAGVSSQDHQGLTVKFFQPVGRGS